jgi:hypothetical protein
MVERRQTAVLPTYPSGAGIFWRATYARARGALPDA